MWSVVGTVHALAGLVEEIRLRADTEAVVLGGDSDFWRAHARVGSPEDRAGGCVQES